MAARARPQWIRRFPLKEAPRTGDGLFEGEIIEVSQVMVMKMATVAIILLLFFDRPGEVANIAWINCHPALIAKGVYGSAARTFDFESAFIWHR